MKIAIYNHSSMKTAHEPELQRKMKIPRKAAARKLFFAANIFHMSAANYSCNPYTNSFRVEFYINKDGKAEAWPRQANVKR